MSKWCAVPWGWRVVKAGAPADTRARPSVVGPARAITVLVLFAASGACLAQGLGALTDSSSGKSVQVDRETVRQRALESFRRLMEDTVQESGDSEDRAAIADKTRAVLEHFSSKVTRTLWRLEGDGLLMADEVEHALTSVRDEYATELLTVVSAMRTGFPPPPLSRYYDSNWQYGYSLLSYTILVRNPLRNWGYFLGWGLAGLSIAWALNAGANHGARRLADRGWLSLGEIFGSLAGPLYLAALSLCLHLGLKHLWVPSIAMTALQGTVEVLLVSSFFWVLWNGCPGVAIGITRFLRKSYRNDLDWHAQNILVRGLRVLVLASLTLVIIRVILETSITGILAGLGIIGLALYLILRGTLENITASVTIFGDEPFRVGDMMIYDGEWGTVEDIGFRSTQFRTFDGHLVTIPNANLIETAIHNAGARPHIRRRFRLGLAYETPPEKVRRAIEIVKDILTDHRGMPQAKPAHVVLETFGVYDLQLLVQYYYEPPDYWEALEFDTEVNLEILARFADAEIEMAYPTHTQILSGSDTRPPPKLELVRDGPGDTHGPADDDSQS